MTVLRGFAITVLSGIVFGVIGALLGCGLGYFAPDYYRLVFEVPPGMELNPFQVGLGLGLTQGLAAGLGIGLTIVLIVAASEWRKNANKMPQ